MRELSDLDKWEFKPIKFIATKATKDYVVMIINYWRAKWCEDKDYNEERGYGHLVYNLNTKSREYIQYIRLNFYKDE